MMENTVSQKLQLGFDLTLCSLCLLLTLHSYAYLSAMWSLWLLRMWTSMLLYRRSTMAAYAIGLSAIAGLLAFTLAPSILALVMDVVRVVVSFFGGEGHMLEREIWDNAYEQGYIRGARHVIGWLTYLWLVVCPLIRYIVLAAKKQLTQSSWSKRSSILLCLYLMGMMCLTLIGGYRSFVHLFIATCGVCALPYLFKEIDIKHLLTRGEASYVMLLLVLVVAYVSGSNISRQAVVAVIALPAVCFAIFNYACSRRLVYQEMALVVLGSMTFWLAQYTTNMFRISLLILSLGLIGVSVGMFIHATRCKWRGLMVFLLAAVVVPVLSLGYNPYSAMEASRLGDEFVGYRFGDKGLMWVRSSKGFGLRDRYDMIIPAQYREIKFLDDAMPYAKVRMNEEGWVLYDIERREFVTHDTYSDIRLYEKDVIRLQKDSCDTYVKCEDYYDWYRNKEQFVPTDSIP